MPLFGIDVSTNNGFINHNAVKLAGVRFAMIKATQGHSLYSKGLYMFKDSKFDANVEGFYKAGIPIGAYHFFTASTLEETYREADFFINTVKPYQNKISLYLACDAENYGNKWLQGLSRNGLASLVNVFCHRVEEAGFKACHYTNTDHIRNYINIDKIAYPVWQAHYLQNGSVKRPEEAGDKLAMHQYTSTGQLPGVVGNFDLNFGYAPLARLIIKSKTTLEDQTLAYIEKYPTGGDILTRIADKLVARNLNPIKNPAYEKLVPLIRYHCALTNEETEYLAAYRWNTDLFRKLYEGMIK